MAKSPSPARLYVILASEASVAVILRRGPSRWVQMIKWYTDTDQFEEGQWIRARVYERKCDLSPDGKLFIYFVFRGRREKYGYAWTAISKPPYFTALALWTEYGTWGGGGHFLNNNTVRLSSVLRDEAQPDFLPTPLTVLDRDSEIVLPLVSEQNRIKYWETVAYGIHDYEKYKSLVVEKGQLDADNDWFQLSDKEKGKKDETWYTQYYVPTVSQKVAKDYTLESRYFGYCASTGDLRKYFVFHNQTGKRHLLANATWADFDQQSRLVLAKEGKLFSATLAKGELNLTELADFNANKPEPIEAPNWHKNGEPMTKPPRARLFVLLARDAQVGIILRKGPHNWTQMIKWHTDTDIFEEGQWVYGRTFEYDGDVSPDGTLLYYHLWNDTLYYAQQSGRAETTKLTSYHAISKAPYFTALSLWQPIFTVGGLFVSNTTLHLYTNSEEWHPIRTIPQLQVETRSYEIDSLGKFPHPKDHFLTNRGWKSIQKGERDIYGNYLSPYIWNKSSSDLTLDTKYFGYVYGGKLQGGGDNQLQYSLLLDKRESELPLQNVNWADFDQQGRLVLTKHGKLFSATIKNDKLQLTELADFNANKPEPIEAPDWAKKW